EIKKEDVRLRLLKDFQRLLSAADLSDHGEILLYGEKPAERVPKNRMVICNGDANFVRITHWSLSYLQTRYSSRPSIEDGAESIKVLEVRVVNPYKPTLTTSRHLARLSWTRS